MNVLDVVGLEKSFGARKIIDNVTFAVGEDEKIGLIGRNGAGKSTLLMILGGMEDREGGTIAMKRGATTGYLSQEPLLDPELTVAEEIERGLREIRQAMAEYTELSARMAAGPADMERLLKRQGELSGWIEHHGGWNTDYRVGEMMTHLQLPEPGQRIAELSGGTKRRVALAKLLLEGPDLLMLDEPTNHLDADTTQWLQDYLKNYPGAVVLITHDRYFLDQVATRMLELDAGAISSYSGGYTSYLEQKEEQLLREEQSRSRLLNLLRVETAWIRRGAKARTTKQKARIDRYEALQEKNVVQQVKDSRIAFTTDATLGGTVLEFHDLGKSFGSRTLLTELTFLMKRGDRIGIIGPNGCGKSTLLKMIMGEEHPDRGSVVVGKKTRIAYFDQTREVLDPEQTIYDFLGEGDYVQLGGTKRHKIGYLEDFLFSPSDRRRKIATLSGGEKSRLIFARLMLQDANLLILDEPTNDLDIPTLQLLDESLANFPGCVLMVTHDRFFLDKVATGILAFEGNGKAVFYEGNYSHYRDMQEQARLEEKSAAQGNERRPAKATPREQVKQKKGLTFGERLELEKLEPLIEELEQHKAALEAKLANPLEYAKSAEGISGLSADYSKLEQELAGKYARWEELEMKKAQS
ncbi:energy-dependent translational throttle protein EttA [Geotalea sp. SG265]|uniref:energy-dependent translational throttle protein EttA n=1 Tax=Geotalea sp. SG265 TaxID=2922867 RepID=UPI001FAFE827|nr:energy-dependent translational throttle protein EttA [Geotalea sp. SG265]